MEYKGFTVDDNKIDEYCEKLDCSIIDACDLILEEMGKIETPKEIVENAKDMEKKANGGKRRYEKSDKPRKATSKERKIDETKGRLLGDVKVLVEGLGATETVLKTETELHFTFEGEKYTFKLTKHRPPKK